MKIINLTPHDINIVGENKKQIAHFSKAEVVPRLKQETIKTGDINGIPITETQFGKVQNLPEPKKGVKLIVSRLVLTACSDRNDLLVPNGVVRDENGDIIGSKSLAES